MAGRLTPLDLQALFVRNEAALRLRKDGELGAWEALRMVLIPTEDVWRASMQMAAVCGPSTRAIELASRGTRREPRPLSRWAVDDRGPA